MEPIYDYTYLFKTYDFAALWPLKKSFEYLHKKEAVKSDIKAMFSIQDLEKIIQVLASS